jgi:hypothetical protein
MPEKEIKKRGGAKAWRTIKTGKNKFIRVAIVRKKGKRGGTTVSGPVHTKKAK